MAVVNVMGTTHKLSGSGTGLGSSAPAPSHSPFAVSLPSGGNGFSDTQILQVLCLSRAVESGCGNQVLFLVEIPSVFPALTMCFSLPLRNLSEITYLQFQVLSSKGGIHSMN